MISYFSDQQARTDLAAITRHIPSNIISLPTQYYLVVGDTFELFYRGILRVGNIYHYNIYVSCAKGKAYKRKYAFTPEAGDAGTHILTVTVKDDGGEILDTKSVNLIVEAKATAVTTVPADDGTHNLIDNSLVQAGYWANTASGAVSVSSGWSVTAEIPVTTGETYQCYPFAKYIVFYDASHNYVSASAANITTIVIPAGVAYARCDYNATTLAGSRNFVKSATTPTGYVETYAEYISDIKPTDVMLCLGDSLTAGGEWVTEMYRRLTAADGTPTGDGITGFTFIGSVGTTPLYEGYGGWTLSSYLGASSPFYIGGAIDFSAYATSMSVSYIGIVNILLGWNSSTTDEVTYKGLCRTFIDAVRSAFPNAYINLIGEEVGNQDGMGDDYTPAWDFYEKTQFILNLNEWLEEVAAEYTNVLFTQLSGQFDSEYGLPVSTVVVNARSSSTESVGTNAIHPLLSGYYQIADAVYRATMHILNL
jgi:hypothetical protein